MDTLAQLPLASPDATAARPLAHRLPTAGRLVMGVAFLVFGLDGFFAFMPRPPAGTMPAAAEALGGALFASGYMMPLVKGTEVFVGALLLSNRFVPLALAMIAPVLVNIVAFHGFLAPAGLGPGLVLLALELYLAWSYRDAYRPMLTARTWPTRS